MQCLLLGTLLLTLAFTAGIKSAVAQGVTDISEEYLAEVLSITFSTMNPTTESGSVSIPGMGTISWEAGMTADQFLRLGNFYDSFNLQLFSMQDIAKAAGIDLSTFTLADFPLSDMTLQDLITAIPDLGQWKVYDIPVVQDLLGTVFDGSGPWDELTIQQAIEQYGFAGVANLTLGELDLSQYGLVDAIPGLTEMALARLPNWQKIVIDQIPGLNQVPFASVPTAPSGAGFVAKLDMPYGKKEARRLNTITGSNVEGFNVPCHKNSCSYIELSGSFWLGATALHGKQWIKGGTASDAQMVRGGSGALALINGGKEPTGRHPYGRGFKVVLKGTDESKGEAEFALYFRYCNNLGCSPYIIGPIPWFTNHEKDIIFVGLTLTTTPPPDIPNSPEILPPEVTGPGVDPGVEPINEDCMVKLLRAISSGMRASAQQSLSLIMSEAARNGVSDLGQLAYVLATAQAEPSFGQFMVEISPPTTISGGIRYRGRGYVQVSHDYNYKYWSKRLGIDLVNNPERAAEPEIAARILILGMRDGTFTGVTREGNLIAGGGYKLSDFIQGRKTDFRGARKIVNGNDRASEIARNAQRYLAILQECGFSGGGSSTQLCRVGSKLLWPTKGVLTSGYGWRKNRMHNGIDVAAPQGTALLAADCGVVSRAQYGNNGGYGNIVEVRHPNGMMTRYAHIKPGGIQVSQGMAVRRGQYIAQMGTTGNSTGPHLHFEAHPSGSGAVDPMPYFK